MAKTEVYSWRVAVGTKAELQRAAKRSNQSIGGLLDRIVREWLEAHPVEADTAEQKRLHEAASTYIGVLRRGRPYSAEETRRVIRERLARKYGCSRPD
ncbi:MAG: hypothetical protein JOZ29_15765 [Deltaproteobacteria bacterium]|nr:hypothetical protein [Deltaproteobacteria bacterium]